MKFWHTGLALVLGGALCAPATQASSVHRGPTSGKAHASKSTSSSKSTKSTKGKKSKGYKRVRGQQEIEPTRVLEIQQALIREKFLDGEPTGKWDATTINAMQKFQAAQGWQTKLMPDSRALKKLGLGADSSNALNAKDAGASAPAGPGTTPPDQAASFAAAARVDR